MLKLNLTLIFGLLCLLSAGQQNNFFCGFDQEQSAIYHNDSLRQVRHERAVEISLRAREFRAYRTDPNRAGGGEVGVLNQDCFVIPVVVHVFHAGEPLNEGTNISYAQIHSAINRLNESFAGVNGGVDTKIRFCLVQETSFGMQWADPTEPGILRYENPYSSEVTLSETMVTEVIATNSPVLFESGTIVHIATVQNIEGIGFAGSLALAPDYLSGTGSVNPMVRIRPSAFGHTLDDNDPLVPFFLDPLFLQNATIAHEMGHVFGLEHTFGGPSSLPCDGSSDSDCDFLGDYICDTPPCTLGLSASCASGPFFMGGIDVGNSCSESVSYVTLDLLSGSYVPFPNPLEVVGPTTLDMYDMIENQMSYSADACRTLFTPHQRDYMAADILIELPFISSFENLARYGLLDNTGCLGAFTLVTSSFAIETFDWCEGVISASGLQGVEGVVNDLFEWTLTQGDTPLLTQTGVTFSMSGLEPGNYTLALIVSSLDGTSAETQHHFAIGDCSSECSIVCNGGFELTGSNLVNGFPWGGTVGLMPSTCTTGVEMMPCWDSHGIANIVGAELNSPSTFIWGAYPLFFWPSFPSNINQLSTVNLPIFNSRYARIGRVVNHENDYHGALQNALISPTLNGENYWLEFRWAYQSDLAGQDADNMEIQVGLTSTPCIGIVDGPFPQAPTSFTQSLNPLVTPEMAWQTFGQAFTGDGSSHLQFSLIEAQTINQANHFTTLFLDEVYIVHESANPVSISFIQNEDTECAFHTIEIVVTPDLNSSSLYLVDQSFEIQAYAFDGTNLTADIGFEINDVLTNGFTIPSNSLTNGSVFSLSASIDLSNFSTQPVYFTIVSTDNLSCIGIPPWTVIFRTVPTNIWNATHVSCPGSCDGVIGFNSSVDGTFAVSLNGLLTPIDEPVDSLCPAVYEVIWTSSDGLCQRVDLIEIVQPMNSLNVTVEANSPACVGGTGNAIATIVGGWTGDDSIDQFNYIWSDSQGNQIGNSTAISSLPPGDYTLSVTSTVAYGAEFNVDNDPPIELLSGNASPITYAVPGCVQEVPFTITAGLNALPIVSYVLPECSPTGTGEISVTHPDNSWSTELFFEGEVLPGQTSYSGLLPGTYLVISTSQSGCTNLETIALVNLNCCDLLPMVGQTTISGTACGTLEGTMDISVEISGGLGPYTYDWTFNGYPWGQEPQVSNVFPGYDVSINVIDAFGCIWFEEFSTPVSEVPIVAEPSVTPATCSTVNDGSATVSAFSFVGATAFDMTWINEQGDVVFTESQVATTTLQNAFPGLYQLEILDPNTGCSVTQAVTIGLAPVLPYTLTQTQVANDCSPNNQIALAVSGGTSVFTVEWVNVIDPNTVISTELVLSNISEPGTYMATVTDASGCWNQVGQLSVPISFIAPGADLAFDPVISEPCGPEFFGALGSIVLNASSPTGGVETFNWFNQNGVLISLSEDIFNLTAGTYQMSYVNSLHGCLVEYFTLDALQGPSLNVQITPGCPGICNGALFAEVVGGSTLGSGPNWQVQSTQEFLPCNPPGFCPGLCPNPDVTYVATSAAPNGCVTQVVAGPVGFAADCCPTLDVEVSHIGMHYPGSFGTITLQIINPGQALPANLILSSNLADFSFIPVQYILDGGAPATSLPEIPALGQSETLVLEIQGWFNAPGQHNLEFTLVYADTEFCSDSFAATHSIPVLVQCPADWTSISLSCQNGQDIASTCLHFFYGFPQDAADYIMGFTAQVTYDPGYLDFEGSELSSAATAAGGVIVGENTTTSGITGLSGELLVTTFIEVTFNDEVAFYNNFGSNSTTLNEPLCLNFSPASSNVPLGVNNTLISAALTTLHIVDAGGEDQNGQTQNGLEVYTFGVATDAAFVLFTEDTPDACFEGIAMPDASFSISPNAPYCSLAPLTASANYSGEGLHIWEVSVNNTYFEIWGLSTITIDPNGDGEGIFYGPGQYTIQHTIIDDNGVAAQSLIDVVISASSPVIEQVAVTNATCPFPNGSAEVTDVLGGYGTLTYAWNDPTQSTTNAIQDVAPGQYTVQVTDEAGCSDLETVTIGANLPDCCGETTLLLTLTQPICGLDLGAVSIGVLNPLGVFTTTVVNANNQVADPAALAPGDYTVFATNAFGCELSQVFTISQPLNAPLDINVLANQPVCASSSDGSLEAIASGGNGAYAYTWSVLGEVVSDVAILNEIQAGSYNVTVTDGENCTLSVSYDLQAEAWDYPNNVIVANVGNGAEIIPVAEAQAWSNQSVSFGGTLTFQQGVEVTLTNANFIFNDFSEVVLEEGTEVTFVNCTFDACSEMWLGFDLRSDATTSTSPAEINLDGCTLSNAYTAIQAHVTNWLGVYTISNINTWRAGHINCDNTAFVNNRVSVEVHRSSALNNFLIGFDHCTFEVNDNNRFEALSRYGLTPVFAFSYHVLYQHVKGYHIRNCTFSNEMTTNVASWADRGAAIKAINANFTVNNAAILDAGNPYATPHFSGFSRAIYAHVNLNPWNGMRVLNASFDQNKVGVFTSNVCFHTIANNHLRVGEPLGLPVLDQSNDYEGIVVLGGAGFAIAQNTLRGSLLTPASSATFGVRVRDTRTDDDEVYKNFFFDLDYANLANGENIPPEGNEFGGLRYVCNENTNNRFDFRVSDFNIAQGTQVLAIAQNQNGTGQFVQSNENIPAAANSFTANPQETFGHFFNEGEDLFYLPAVGLVPTNFNSSVIDLPPVFEFSCPTYSPIVKPDQSVEAVKYIERRSSFNAAFTEWQNTKFIWAALIDEGDTPALKQEVELSWPENTWLMRDQLLAISPNVSKAVLKEVADKTWVYPHPVAFEIFLANPDIIRDARFMSYLETKADPMPAYMIDLLYLVRDQRTFRTNLEQEMSHFRAQSLQNAYELIRANYQLSDSSAVLAQDLSMVEGFALELNAAFATLAGGASGSSVLNNLYGYSNDFNASFESSQLGALLALQEAMWLSDRAWMDATNAEVLALEGIADHYMTYAGRMAQEILNHHFEQHWFVPPAIGGLWTPRSVRIAAAEGNNEPALKLYPNPASVIVTVELTLPGNAAGATFRVYDARGKVVHERTIERNYEVFSLNTSQWASATYSFEMIAAGSRKTGKFVIQH